MNPQLLIAGALGAAVASVSFPLATYTCTLAAFGLPHVIAELRYVGRRFHGRWPASALIAVSGLLGLIVTLRVLVIGEHLSPSTARPLELGAVLALAGLTLPALWRRGLAATLGGLSLIGLVAVGVYTDPLLTAVLLAGLHNLTPLGFIAEAAPAPQRRLYLAGALAAFVILPGLIATGLPVRGLSALGLLALEWSPMGTEGLYAHLEVYVPTAWLKGEWALHLFSAMVFAQCMHYAAVIHVLPRLEGAPDPRRVPVAWALVAIGALTLLAFSRDFTGSRQLYGVIAAVHAWVEVPVLLAALLGPAPALRTRPTG